MVHVLGHGHLYRFASSSSYSLDIAAGVTTGVAGWLGMMAKHCRPLSSVVPLLPGAIVSSFTCSAMVVSVVFPSSSSYGLVAVVSVLVAGMIGSYDMMYGV